MANQIKKSMMIIGCLLYTSILSAGVSNCNGGGIENILVDGNFENVTYNYITMYRGTAGAWDIVKDSYRIDCGVTFYDIDGGGPLEPTDAFCFNAGAGGGMTIYQQVNLSANTAYDFSANIGSRSIMGTHSDGGRITASIHGGGQLAMHNFGEISIETPEYATLSGQYTPSSSGVYTLMIEIYRDFPASKLTVVNYVDNVQFGTYQCPVIPVPGAFSLAIIGTGLCGWMRRRKYETFM